MALRWAARQATLTGDELTAVAAWEWPTTLGWVPAYPPEFDPASDAEKVLNQAVDAIRAEFPNLKIHTTSWREEQHRC
jgi:hypothetical protein